MVRIASVKYPNNSKTLDYLCPDTSIHEGDVVYLEGNDKPHYIVEIKKVDNKDNLATKKVLSKAILNDNVTLSSKYMDITR